MILRERLAAQFPEASGHRLKRWLATGRVQVNGRVIRDGRVAVAPGDAVALGHPAGRATPTALPGGVRLVHEDGDIVVIDKPPGLLTIATERERDRTAYRIVRDHFAARQPPSPVFIVHRLDRETSGLLVLARSPQARRALQSQFAARTVERGYAAVVRGVVRADAGTLTSQLVEDGAHRVRSLSGHRPRPRGATERTAITGYRVVERRASTTLLEVTLGTGRRRQIRVQLAEMGHPVLGDAGTADAGPSREGGGRDAGARGRGPGRLLLHATRLGFVHPRLGEPVRFESPPPPAFGIPSGPGAPGRRPPRRGGV